MPHRVCAVFLYCLVEHRKQRKLSVHYELLKKTMQFSKLHGSYKVKSLMGIKIVLEPGCEEVDSEKMCHNYLKVKLPLTHMS